MQARDDLHRLILSLSSTEKRYFKLYVGKTARREENKYLVLFEAISDMQEYDEQLLRKILIGESQLRQLAVAKIYLHELILRCLGEYGRGRNIPNQLRNLLDQAEILLARGLTEDLSRRVEKGYKMALEYDHLAYALEFLRWKIKLCKRRVTTEDFKLIPKLQQEELQLLAQMQVESQLRIVHDEIFATLSSSPNHSDAVTASRMQSAMGNPCLQVNPSTLRFNSQLILLQIHVLTSQHIGDMQKFHETYASIIKLWESHPKRLYEEPERYLNSLDSFLESCYLLNNFSPIPETQKKLAEVKLPNLQLAAKAFYFSIHLDLVYATNTGNPPIGPDLEQKIALGLQKFGSILDMAARLSLFSNLAILYFFREEFSRSLMWANLVYNAEEKEIRKDIRAFVLCLRMVIQFELGDMDLVGYLLQSTRRNISRQHETQPLQRVLVRHLQQLLNSPDSEAQLAWMALFDSLQDLSQLYNDSISGINILQVWVQSKLTKRPIIALVQERYQKLQIE